MPSCIHTDGGFGSSLGCRQCNADLAAVIDALASSRQSQVLWLVGVMREKHLLRAKVGDIELEMADFGLDAEPARTHSESPKTPDAVPGGSSDGALCPCGHDDSEHSGSGCLMGCAERVCVPAADVEAKA